MSSAPLSALAEVQRRLESDTGYYARKILGMDKDGRDGEPGKGGVRPYGPHQEMVELLDNEKKRLLCILMPRNSYKSSILRAYIGRSIIQNPDVAILLCMHDLDKAEERVAEIAKDLTENELIRELYGDLKGPSWKPQSGKFTVSTRPRDSLIMEPTLTACARDALPTGGHYHIIVLDDIVDDQAVRTEEGVANSIRALGFLMPLRLVTGKFLGKVVDVGTVYDDEDVHNYIINRLEGWHVIRHEVGYEVQEQENGKLSLTGENPLFPWLSKEFLEQQLAMGFTRWMSQYKNRMVGNHQGAFKREQFQSVAWEDGMRNYTGYLLTDTASSDKDEACFSVLAYVALDERLRLFILDVQMGRWQPGEFIDRFFNMRGKWSAKVTHQAEVLEMTAQNLTYRAYLDKKAREMKLHLNLIQPQRNAGGKANKGGRILRLQPRFQSREVFIVDTITRTYVDQGQLKELWNPDGYTSGGVTLPSGRLVDEFLRFHLTKKTDVDIPDALAAIDETDPKTGERLCFYRKPAGQGLTAQVQRVKVQHRRPYRSGFRFGAR